MTVGEDAAEVIAQLPFVFHREYGDIVEGLVYGILEACLYAGASVLLHVLAHVFEGFLLGLVHVDALFYLEGLFSGKVFYDPSFVGLLEGQLGLGHGGYGFVSQG